MRPSTKWAPRSGGPLCPYHPRRPGGAGLGSGSPFANAALARSTRRQATGGRTMDQARPLRRPHGRSGQCPPSVGVIDVTPLGKLDLRGPDVPKLLNLVYVNKWSKLGIGGVRYGVMCAEDGVVMDDGVTGRLAEDHYLMTTTSSGAATVWEWIENWLQTEQPEWQVHVTPVTTAYASMNVAGPSSRMLLQRLVEGIDLSPDAFPYMTVRQGTVAGVDCFMWRIGFTGELSYEIHVPASYGLHVWEALFKSGEDLEIGAFGVEAQRIMRLEKGHFIVGQDTDGLMQGFSAGLDWLIKLDKEDFAGKTELAWQGNTSMSTWSASNPSIRSGAARSEPDNRERQPHCRTGHLLPVLPHPQPLDLPGRGGPPPCGAGNNGDDPVARPKRIQATVMAHHAHFDPKEPGSVFDTPVARSPIAQAGPVEIIGAGRYRGEVSRP